MCIYEYIFGNNECANTSKHLSNSSLLLFDFVRNHTDTYTHTPIRKHTHTDACIH